MAYSPPLKPETSIIIRAFNEAQYLQQCLDAIYTQSYKNFEIILVYDPRSSDATLQIAKDNGIKIVELQSEFSFGYALNLGSRAAAGDFLVYVSAHAIALDQNWLAELISVLQDDIQVAGSYSRQIPADGAYSFWQRVLAKSYPNAATNHSVVFSNASSAIRKSEWQVYNFREDLSGSEDWDWAIQAQQRGKQTAYCCKSQIRHSHNETFEQMRVRAKREILALIEIGVTKPGLAYFLKRVAATIKNILADLLYCMVGRSSLSELYQALSFRIASLLGSIQAAFSERQS